VIITWVISVGDYLKLPDRSTALLDLTSRPKVVIQAWQFWRMQLLVTVMSLQELRLLIESEAASCRRTQLQMLVDQ
jgi:hypothetical protein